MKTIELSKSGKNFTAVNVGKLNDINQYVLPLGDIEIPGNAGDTRPIERSRVNRVVPRFTFHQGQRRTYVVFYLTKFFFVATPCQNIEVCPNRSQSLRVRQIKILLYPLLIDLIAKRQKNELNFAYVRANFAMPDRELFSVF